MQHAVDSEAFGRLVRGWRITAGMRTVAHAVDALASRNVDVSERTFAAMERGEQRPTLSFAVAFAAVFGAPGGLLYFLPAVREDLRDKLMENISAETLSRIAASSRLPPT